MQNQLLKLVSFTLAILCLTNLTAQESTTKLDNQNKRTEIGLTYEFGNGYSLLFKQQLKEKMFLRGTLNASFLGSNLMDTHNFGLGGSIGLELHIPLNQRWSLYHGPEISAKYSQFRAGDSSSNSISKSIGIGYFTGAIFKVTDRFSIFGEISHTYSENFNTYTTTNPRNPNSTRSYTYNDNSFRTSLKLGATFNLINNKKKDRKIRF